MANRDIDADGVLRNLKLQRQRNCRRCGRSLNLANAILVTDDTEPTPAAVELREDLRISRLELASEGNVPAYYIFSDRTLEELVRKVPQNHEELLGVHGFGEVKVKRYGEEILAVTTQFEQAPEIGHNFDDLYLICQSCDTVEKREVSISIGLREQIDASPYSLDDVIRIGAQTIFAEVDRDAEPSLRQDLKFIERAYIVSERNGRRLSSTFDILDSDDE